jgi:hypothetical protein
VREHTNKTRHVKHEERQHPFDTVAAAAPAGTFAPPRLPRPQPLTSSVCRAGLPTNAVGVADRFRPGLRLRSSHCQGWWIAVEDSTTSRTETSPTPAQERRPLATQASYRKGWGRQQGVLVNPRHVVPVESKPLQGRKSGKGQALRRQLLDAAIVQLEAGQEDWGGGLIQVREAGA